MTAGTWPKTAWREDAATGWRVFSLLMQWAQFDGLWCQCSELCESQSEAPLYLWLNARCRVGHFVELCDCVYPLGGER